MISEKKTPVMNQNVIDSSCMASELGDEERMRNTHWGVLHQGGGNKDSDNDRWVWDSREVLGVYQRESCVCSHMHINIHSMYFYCTLYT